MIVSFMVISCIFSLDAHMANARAVSDAGENVPIHQEKNQWFRDGVNLIKNNIKVKNINKKAKNVILFIGDGMGPSTVTAARILQGQTMGKFGEEHVLSWETFDNVALSKTYNTDKQVGDSAGTAAAFLTGVKTRYGVIGVNESVVRGDCATSIGAKVVSLTQLAESAGLSTGVVTTTRLTHATPANTYAHSPDRDWEYDAQVADKRCQDIASQLVDFKNGNGFEVAFGGGRQMFLPNDTSDPADPLLKGKRTDGRNILREWTEKSKKGEGKYEYIWNASQLAKMDPKKVDHVLGVYSYRHMGYSQDKINSTKEPSLTQMVEFAVNVLNKNPKGYFLLVEGGKIDLAHHANDAYNSLHEAVELAQTVEKVKEITNREETLLIVTADHSHVFTFGGYPPRGNPIFGLTESIALDGKRFSTLAYTNGPGAEINTTRKNVTQQDLDNPNYIYQSLVPLLDDTHGGEDVGIYASGPQAHLIRGVVEQNYIFHVMDYALCLTDSKRKICEKQGLLKSSATKHLTNSLLLTVASVVGTIVYFNC